MAEVDTSSYPKPQPSANDPFTQIKNLGGALDTIGNINVGQAVKQSLGPDGQIDRNMLANILKQNPASAMKIIPALEMEARMRQAGFTADATGYETAQRRFGTINHLIAPLALHPNPTKDDVIDVMSSALDPKYQLKKYGIDLGNVMDWSKNFKDGKGNWLPNDQIKKKAQTMHQQGLAAQQALEAYHQRYEGVQQGSQFSLMPSGSKVNPNLNAAAPIMPGPSQVEYPSGGGQPQYRGAQPPIPGGGAVGPNGQPLAPNGPTPVKTVPITQNQPNPTLGNAAPAGAGQPPGYSETATASGAALANSRSRASSFAGEVFPLHQALDSLEALGTKGTGPGTEELNNIKSFLASNLPSWMPGEKSIDLQKIKNFDEAKKYLTAAAVNRASNFGHGTDSQLATTLAANPNMKISNLAAVDLTKATIALRRMDQAQVLDADRARTTDQIQKWEKDLIGGDGRVKPDKYTQWASQWATNQDPRAYYVDLLNKDQYDRLRKSLEKDKAAAARFNNSLKAAIDNGIVVPNNAGQRG